MTAARIRSLIKISDDGCWLWQGRLTRDGYGATGAAGRSVLAHRLSYETFVGPIPEGLEIDHLCRVRACVNPAHLEPVTHAENVRRGEYPRETHRNGRKVACARGHALDGDNLVLEHDARGRLIRRRCRAAPPPRWRGP